MAIKLIGLDTARHLIQVSGADVSGGTVIRKRFHRNKLAVT